MDTKIDTGRLLLRRFVPDDLDAFYELCSRPAVIRYAQSTPLPSREAAQEFMRTAPSIDFARSTVGLKRLVALFSRPL